MEKIFDQESYEELGSLADFVIPESVTEIGAWAISDCTSLVAVTLLNLKVKIDESAFVECMGITTVNLPEGMTWNEIRDKFEDSPWGQNKPA